MSISENDEYDEELAFFGEYSSDPDTRLIAPPYESAPNVQFESRDIWRERRIWEGYIDASLFLLNEILRDTPYKKNQIFPALYNLRHGIEVALKWHIKRAEGIVPKRAGHDLRMLVETFRQTAIGFSDELTYISDEMIDCILELDSVDPYAMTFRYSTKPNGIPIAIAPDCWDLRRLCCKAEFISMWFNGLSRQIEECWLNHYAPSD